MSYKEPCESNSPGPSKWLVLSVDGEGKFGESVSEVVMLESKQTAEEALRQAIWGKPEDNFKRLYIVFPLSSGKRLKVKMALEVVSA